MCINIWVKIYNINYKIIEPRINILVEIYVPIEILKNSIRTNVWIKYRYSKKNSSSY
jgi:hypothetical protein